MLPFADANLNRQFGRSTLLAPASAADPHEVTRARELAPTLAAAAAVLDLHTASAPTPPFVLHPPRSRASAALAAALPLPYRLADATGAGLGLAIEFAAEAGAAAVTVECGAHGDAGAAAVAAACVRAALAWGGGEASAGPARGALAPLQTALCVARGVVVRPGFRWVTPDGGPPRAFSRAACGAVVARDDAGGDIACDVEGGAYVVMPTAAPVVGEDALLWGEDEEKEAK